MTTIKYLSAKTSVIWSNQASTDRKQNKNLEREADTCPCTPHPAFTVAGGYIENVYYLTCQWSHPALSASHWKRILTCQWSHLALCQHPGMIQAWTHNIYRSGIWQGVVSHSWLCWGHTWLASHALGQWWDQSSPHKSASTQSRHSFHPTSGGSPQGNWWCLRCTSGKDMTIISRLR